MENDWLIRARHPEFGDMNMMAVQEEYQRLALSRAIARWIEGVGDVRFLTVEDILIHKTVANRSQEGRCRVDSERLPGTRYELPSALAGQMGHPRPLR